MDESDVKDVDWGWLVEQKNIIRDKQELGLSVCNTHLRNSFFGVKKKITMRDNYKCRKCQRKPRRIYCHHIIPLILGGTNDPRNLICLCYDCHYQIPEESIIKSQRFVSSNLPCYLDNCLNGVLMIIENIDDNHQKIKSTSKEQRIFEIKNLFKSKWDEYRESNGI